ncbi:MAG: VCBS repeat-containing protein, partial [Alteromonadaceae bacterium]
ASADGEPIVTTFTVNNTVFTVGATAILDEGSLTVNADGSYTFVPTENFNGSVPTVTYTVFDGINTDTSTLAIAVIPVSDLTDDNESVSLNENTSISGDVLANAVSTDGTPVVTTFTVNNIVHDADTSASFTEGTLTINADGSFIFVPATNFDGVVPTVTYTVFDGINTDTSTLNITVNDVPVIPPPVIDTAPDANNDINTFILAGDSVNGAASVSVTGNVIANGTSGDVADTSSDGTIILTQVSFGGVDYVFDISNTSYAITTSFGTLTIDNTGAYSYTSKDGMALPDNAVNDVFGYTIQDGDAVNPDLDTATLSINIIPEGTNIPPVAKDDSFELDARTSATLEVNGNVIVDNGSGVDSDLDGSTLTITHVNGTQLIFDSADSGYETINVEDGILRINAQGDFTYTNNGEMLASDATVAPHSFQYTLSDGTDTATATVTINVTDTAPIANADINRVTLLSSGIEVIADGNVLRRGSSGDVKDTSADGTIKLIQVAYDVNGNGQIEDVEKFDFNTMVTSHTIVTAYGTLTIDNMGEYVYETHQGITLPLGAVAEVFNYTIQDGDINQPDTDTTTLTINITPVSVPTPSPFTGSDDNTEVYFNKTGLTIDTFMQQEHQDSSAAADTPSFASNSALDLSDLVSEEHSNSLDEYLALNEDHEVAAMPELADVESAMLMDQDIILGEAKGEEQQNITNGLLADGAIIISDATAPTTASLIEMDSSELV